VGLWRAWACGGGRCRQERLWQRGVVARVGGSGAAGGGDGVWGGVRIAGGLGPGDLGVWGPVRVAQEGVLVGRTTFGLTGGPGDLPGRGLEEGTGRCVSWSQAVGSPSPRRGLGDATWPRPSPRAQWREWRGGAKCRSRSSLGRMRDTIDSAPGHRGSSRHRHHPFTYFLAFLSSLAIRCTWDIRPPVASTHDYYCPPTRIRCAGSEQYYTDKLVRLLAIFMPR